MTISQSLGVDDYKGVPFKFWPKQVKNYLWQLPQIWRHHN